MLIRCEPPDPPPSQLFWTPPPPPSQTFLAETLTCVNPQNIIQMRTNPLHTENCHPQLIIGQSRGVKYPITQLSGALYGTNYGTNSRTNQLEGSR